MSLSSGLLGGHAHFLHWGVVQISLANLIVIVLMMLVFGVALFVQFPHHDEVVDPVEVPDVPL